jgi:polyferredoxin
MTSKFWRRVSQIFFIALIAFVGIRHQIIGGGPQGAPPLDSYCVFGGVETLYSWIHSGELLLKTNTSNLILLFATLIVTILMGAVFCGWICPLGAIQEGLNWIGRKIFAKNIKVPKKLDMPLRSLKYILLGLITLMTIKTGKLWFEGYDPFKAFFHFEFETSTYVILIIFSILAIFIERFWCKYLCPLGAIIFPLSYFGIINLNRNSDKCTNCNLCNNSCSMGLNPSKSIPKTECVKCLDCMEVCKRENALYLTLGKRGGNNDEN